MKKFFILFCVLAYCIGVVAQNLRYYVHDFLLLCTPPNTGKKTFMKKNQKRTI